MSLENVFGKSERPDETEKEKKPVRVTYNTLEFTHVGKYEFSLVP